MTGKALDVLDKRAAGRGFFLQIEGASIDKHDHAASPCGQIGETIDFDAAVAFQLAFLTARTAIAAHGEAQIGKRRRRKITLLIDLNIVCVGFVGAGHCAAHALHAQIGQDAEFQSDRPQVAGHRIGGWIEPLPRDAVYHDSLINELAR